MRGLLIAAGLAATLLAGCSQPTPNSAAGAAPAASNNAGAGGVNAAQVAAPSAPVNVAAAAPVGAGPIPAPAAGMWRRASTQDSDAPQTSTKCMTGAPIDPTEGMPPGCTAAPTQRTATGGFVFDADCPHNGVDAKLHMTGEGDFTRSFATDATMTMTGGPGGDVRLHNHSAWTYLGPCTPGEE